MNVRDFVDQEEVTRRIEDFRKANPQYPAAEAGGRVEVHTFDFVTLAKAGRAVMLVLSGQEDRLAVKTKRQRGAEPGRGSPRK